MSKQDIREYSDQELADLTIDADEDLYLAMQGYARTGDFEGFLENYINPIFTYTTAQRAHLEEIFECEVTSEYVPDRF